MYRIVLTLSLALALAGSAAGQPWPSYSQQRAYRHFLRSPYPTRTFSTSTPGYAARRYTPWGYEEVYRAPGYFRQEIGPRGFLTYHYTPPTFHYVAPPVYLVPW
jgi:hypothetical protein